MTRSGAAAPSGGVDAAATVGAAAEVRGLLREAGLDLGVISELGRGARTVVYRTRRHGREYAIKLLQSPDGAHEQTLTAFRREAAMLACLHHPGLPQIFEVGQLAGRPYLVIELIDGRPLSGVLQDGPLDEARLLRLGVGVAGALTAAHRAGLVHRDVKPDNILIGSDGLAHLIDFGLATLGGAADGEAVVGTLVYSAPEQAGILKRPVDGRSDLYGLGVVLFECATGVVPFTSSDVGELIRLHATAAAPDPRALRPGLSPAAAAVIKKLLAKDPDDRYQSGEGLLADLHRLIREPGAAGFALGTRDEMAGLVADSRLVGRHREHAQLVARWRQARAGYGGIALVHGPPGVGKSRLTRELVATARADGRLALHGACSPDEAMPLAPIRSAVERYLRTVGELPADEQTAAVQRLRTAAGDAAALLRPLSPVLAAVLPAPELPADDRHEQFASAVAAFVSELARAEGGAVLHIDDVQWLDGATRRIVVQLARTLPDVPLLLVATARDDPDSAAAVDLLRAELGGRIDTQLSLDPLPDDAVTELVSTQLGGGAVDRKLTRTLTHRTGGNPFAVHEYVRAALDAGLLRPSWGGWLLDADGMDRLELSGDVLNLILRRIEGLGGPARRLLVAAAAIGGRFRPALLAQVCDIDRVRLADVLGDAAARRLVEARDGGGYAFLHDRIREALLADLEPDDLRRLHQRIAEALDTALPGATDAGSERIYAVARHYVLGETHRCPDRVHTACAEAGAQALADHAPTEALAFLEQAAATAAAAGLAPDGAFHESLGVALARNGRFDDALQSLTRALDSESDRLRRAAIHGLIARVHLSAWRHDESILSTARALRELGRPLPRSRFMMVLTTLASFAAGLVVGRTRIGFGTATGEARQRYRLLASLYDVGAYAAAVGMRLPLQLNLAFRSLYPANRLGPGPEYARRLAGFGVIAHMARRHRLAERLFARAADVAARLADPTLAAHVEWKRGAGRYMGGVDRGETWARVFEERGRWLDIDEYLTGVATWCCQLALRGRTREAEIWYQRARARLSSGAEAEGSALTAVGVLIPAQAGRSAEAAKRLRPVREFVRVNPLNVSQRVNMVGALMYIAVEQADYGAAFSEALDEFERLPLRRTRILGEQRVIFVHCALGWLARLADAAPAQRPEVRKAAERAVAELGRAAGGSDLLRACHRVTRASLAQLDGRPEKTLALLAEADRLGERIDAPALVYEVARVRARALRALGAGAAADRQASMALHQANQQGWPHRARWVRTEFGVSDTMASASHGALRESDGGSLLAVRRLKALQQVSLAAATVLDPSELARVALDETVRILGAERAYLFLHDPRLDRLVPHLGRDAHGQEIGELTGYSSTLVERVRDTREPLVVTGSDEGAALGSQSAVVHGLRSIMIAPLQLDERLLGVVYLDSRVAKGIFTADDVDILVAITNHVAISLETARAAQFEAAVQAAGRQRDVAEKLRATMAELSMILDPEEVLRRLLGTVIRVLPGDVAALLCPDHGRPVLTALYGDVPPDVGAGTALDTTADPVLARLLTLTGPEAGSVGPGRPAPAERVLGRARCWLALPVAERGDPLGVLLVGSRQIDRISDAQVEVVATLAGQGMIAYENARLFSEVQRLATTDGLTGLHNRSHFFDLAASHMETARRHATPTAAIMLDIDHFKQVNDRHGHAVGDEVIRVVADRLRTTCRQSDVLGRYGGEEFALLTPETGTRARDLAERLRAAIGRQPVPTGAGALRVTISVGMATVDDGAGGLRELLARADAALYDAKQAGRDRVAAR